MLSFFRFSNFKPCFIGDESLAFILKLSFSTFGFAKESTCDFNIYFIGRQTRVINMFKNANINAVFWLKCHCYTLKLSKLVWQVGDNVTSHRLTPNTETKLPHINRNYKLPALNLAFSALKQRVLNLETASSCS